MSEFGGVNAESLKKGIDSIFSVDGFLPLDAENYRQKIVSVTADGANVYFGVKSGLLAHMKSIHPLVTENPL